LNGHPIGELQGETFSGFADWGFSMLPFQFRYLPHWGWRSFAQIGWGGASSAIGAQEDRNGGAVALPSFKSFKNRISKLILK
jgi:hypothetical protein